MKNQLTGLTRTEQAEAKKKLVRDGRLQWVRELIKAGNIEQAERYSKTYDLPFMELKAEATLIVMNPKATFLVQVDPPVREELTEEVTVNGLTIVASEIGSVDVNGWPVKAEAEVWRRCLNRKLVVIRLEDGREATMWNEGTKGWAMGLKLPVKLESAAGDPIYAYDR